MKLAIVLGTRPEAIKLAPVIVAARAEASVEPLVVSSGQHRDMLRPVLRLFGVEPDIDLDLMRLDQTLADIASRTLAELSRTFERARPDAVVVQGDTTTALMGALAAFYQKIPVAHVEAGLRTDDLDAPYPEELNRRVVSQMARWHLAPTAAARDNLLRDGIDRLGGRIVVTGNTVIDALLLAVQAIKRAPPEHPELEAALAWKQGPASPTGQTSPTRPTPPTERRRVILVTGHRRENFGEPFRDFCLGLRDIAEAHPEALLIYPVHLNPNVQKPVREILSGVGNVRLAAVADYPAFVAMMQAADFVITDSGGVQEEAPALGKPVLVTRRVTERPEAVRAGGVRLVGPDREAIRRAAHELLTDESAYRAMARARSPYGDGRAAPRCLDAILGRPVEEFTAPQRLEAE